MRCRCLIPNRLSKARMPEPTKDSSSSSRHEWFVTTHWSVVLASRRNDSTQGRAALEKLCQTYWYPLYAFVRRLGHNPHDAEDLVQGFFERCLEKNYLAAADQAKGRFRSFLLLALKLFVANEWDKARSRKRGEASMTRMRGDAAGSSAVAAIPRRKFIQLAGAAAALSVSTTSSSVRSAISTGPSYQPVRVPPPARFEPRL